MKLYSIYYNSEWDRWMLFTVISTWAAKAFFYLPTLEIKDHDPEDEKRFFFDADLRGNDENYWGKRLEEKYNSEFARLLISSTFINLNLVR